jgi:aldose 1-epimerase
MAFETIISSFGNRSVITLKDLSTNTFAEIYSYGALLNQFSGRHGGGMLNVVDGFSGLQEATEKLTTFFKSAKLSPYACRVNNSKYNFGEGNYSLTKFSLRGTAIHGLLYDADFSIKQHSHDENGARVKLEFTYDKASEGYPFSYKCEVEYTLTEGNALSVSTTVSNVDEKLLPVVDGWHPYFTLGDRMDGILISPWETALTIIKWNFKARKCLSLMRTSFLQAMFCRTRSSALLKPLVLPYSIIALL